MRRRKLLIGMGSLAAGGAAATGTGAFTSVTAKRSVSVNVVSDNNAYLSLIPQDERVSKNNNGQIEIDFTDGNSATGLNPNARTAFHDLFEIQNRGSNDVHVSVGVSKEGAYMDPDDTPSGVSAPTSSAKDKLLEDYSGINVVYTYGETDSNGNQDSVGLGNPAASSLDAGGRVWLVNDNDDSQGTVLSPGDGVDLDLSIVTGNSPTTESGVGLYIFAVEPDGERDISN